MNFSNRKSHQRWNVFNDDIFLDEKVIKYACLKMETIIQLALCIRTAGIYLHKFHLINYK